MMAMVRLPARRPLARAWLPRYCALLLMIFSALASAAPSAGAAPGNEVARLGMYMKIARDLNRADVRAAFEVWTDELFRKFQVPAEVRFYSDLESLRRDFDAGLVNLVIADAMTFVRHFRQEELADGFTTKLSKDASLLLFARAGSASEDNPKGKRIARLADDEVSTTYLETLCMRRAGSDCADARVTIVDVPNNHQAMSRLLFGQVDLALVNRHGFETAAELNPQLRRAGTVVAELKFDTQFFGFYSAKVSPEFRKFSLRAAPDLHLEGRGRQMLDVFKTERLAVAEPSVLRPFYDLERDYRRLRAQLERRKGR